MQAVRMVRLYADAAGETHFADDEFDFALLDFSPGSPALEVSQTYDARQFVVVRIAGDWTAKWHPSPQRQIWIGLEGTIRVTASDGETRDIPPGQPWLMEDMEGRGHVTAAGGGRVIGAVTLLGSCDQLAD